MKKIKKISPKNLKNIVKEHFLEDTLLSEDKIDRIIKNYLLERDRLLDDDDFLTDRYEIDPQSKESLNDMVDNLNEMLDDLDIIKEKEYNVLVFNDIYADEYLNGIMRDLEDIVDDLKYLLELKDSEKNTDNK